MTIDEDRMPKEIQITNGRIEVRPPDSDGSALVPWRFGILSSFGLRHWAFALQANEGRLWNTPVVHPTTLVNKAARRVRSLNIALQTGEIPRVSTLR